MCKVGFYTKFCVAADALYLFKFTNFFSYVYTHKLLWMQILFKFLCKIYAFFFAVRQSPLPKMIADEDVNLLRGRRTHTIRMLQQFAETADAIYQGRASADFRVNAVGVLGGALGVAAGGAMVFASGGLATPLVVSGLSISSGVTSLGSGILSISNASDCTSDSSRLRSEIITLLKRDEIQIIDVVKQILLRCRVRESLEPEEVKDRETSEIFCISWENRTFSCSVRIADRRLLSYFKSVVDMIKQGGFPLLAGIVALGAGFCVPIEIGGKAAQQVLKELAEEGTKQVATEATEEGAKTITKEIAKKGAKTSVQTVAKAVAAVNIVFGGVTAVWEVYKAYKNIRKSHEESELGKELRKLACELEVEERLIGLLQRQAEMGLED